MSTALDDHQITVDGDVAFSADLTMWVADRVQPDRSMEADPPSLVLASPAQIASGIAPASESGCSIVAMDLSPDELRAAVVLTAGGSQVLSPRARPHIGANRRTAELTPRELEVLRALGNGNAAKNISRQLNLSVKTVEVHKASLFKKLGVRTASEAVSVALTTGLLPEASPEHP